MRVYQLHNLIDNMVVEIPIKPRVTESRDIIKKVVTIYVLPPDNTGLILMLFSFRNGSS
jgi:hypothetical protein